MSDPNTILVAQRYLTGLKDLPVSDGCQLGVFKIDAPECELSPSP